MTHPNSHASKRLTNLNARERQIIAFLSRWYPATDREIMKALGRVDPNYVRPCITGLIKAGVLYEVDSVKCPDTGRMVRRVWFTDDGEIPVAPVVEKREEAPVETGGLFPQAENVGTVWRGE